MKNPKPNTVLPKNGKLLKPTITRKISGWVKMSYDAEVVRNGLTWLRVEGGMGGRHDREDWVLAIPYGQCSVHSYHWNGEDFGPGYGSFDNACIQESKAIVLTLENDLVEMRERISIVEKTLRLLKHCHEHRLD